MNQLPTVILAASDRRERGRAASRDLPQGALPLQIPDSLAVLGFRNDGWIHWLSGQLRKLDAPSVGVKAWQDRRPRARREGGEP